MITTTLQIVMILCLFLYFALLLSLLKKKKLNLKYTLLWLFSGVVMLILAIFPKTLNWLSALLGIYDATNALFAILFFCGIIILVSLTAIVSKLTMRVVRLTQTIAILEKRIKDLEQ